MTAAHSPLFPGSRDLSGWWRALAPRQPRALWVGHLLFHHVEALVRVHRPEPPDRFTLLVLQALTRVTDRTVPGIDRLLHLGPRMLSRVLRGLADEKLAMPEASGAWGPTPLGLRILRGEGPHANDERRVFHFLSGAPLPRFVPLTHSSAVPTAAAGEEPFDPSVLHACVRQSAEWKHEHGFPLDVEEVVAPEASAAGAAAENHHIHGAAPSWQRVIVAHPEQLFTVLILQTVEGDGQRVEGFAVQPGKEEIRPEPAFTLPADARETLTEPPPEGWQHAWRNWGNQHRLPAAEVESCRFELREERLVVHAPAQLVESLQDKLGESWLLAGDGPIRRAARVELINAG